MKILSSSSSIHHGHVAGKGHCVTPVSILGLEACNDTRRAASLNAHFFDHVTLTFDRQNERRCRGRQVVTTDQVWSKYQYLQLFYV